jgi:hypothetical protein
VQQVLQRDGTARDRKTSARIPNSCCNFALAGPGTHAGSSAPMLHRLFVISLVLDAACTEPASVEPLPNLATGELGAWQTAPALPTPRANHCSAAIDDWILVIGGNFKQGESFVKTDEIHAARLADDGMLGPWQLAGRTPSPVTECSATSDGKNLYILDGLYDRDSDARQVFAAPLDDAGQLGALASIATLPQIAISSEAVVHGDQLLMMDTVLPADGDQTITLRTTLAGGGTWSTDDWQIGFRAQAQYAFSANFAYTLGGYLGEEGNPVSSEVFVAAIDDRGALGTARATTSLPAPTAFGEAVVVDDFVFVVGGRAQIFGGEPSNAVYVAQIAPDGSLGTWTTLAALPLPRTNQELAVVGDFLVIAGGAAGMGGDTNVLAARVRFPQDVPVAD